MKAIVVNKETNEEIIFNNVIGYDTHGAAYDGPVFQLILTDGTSTFHKSKWDLYVMKKVS